MRRVSKTFRKFPEIIVHPPENVTASMPDITRKPDISIQLRNSLVNENNLSCPDLADETIYAAYNKQLTSNKTSFESCSSYETTSSDEESSNIFHFQPTNLRSTTKFKTSSKSKLRNKSSSSTLASQRKLNPSDILKRKLKQSVSMCNLFPKQLNYDSYHTIHAYSNCSYPDYFFVTHSLPNRDSNKKKLVVKSEKRNIKKDDKIINKCCCGMTRCKAVVPIQQYLETYFDKRVSELIHNKKKIKML